MRRDIKEEEGEVEVEVQAELEVNSGEKFKV